MARKRAAPRETQVICARCGRAADAGAGALNFCPDCGAALHAAAGLDAGGAGALLGKVVADRYRLLALLGEGGMGAVYRAEHVRMGKALAVKVLRGAFAREPGAAERFRAEARIVSRLSHPHTIAVFDFGEIDDGSGFYLAMEYVPGRDLAAVLRAEGRLPERRVVEIGRQVLGSLAEAHDAGIVHRDVKPANVMLMRTRTGEDFAKVLDFGIAKLRGEAGQAATTGVIVGTPSALAPEQARGDAVDGRADLYAVGCLLHELASGRAPFTATSPMAVVSAHLHQAPPSLAEHAPGTSRRLAEVVLRALAKRPEDRFASADEMRAALLGAADPPGRVTPRGGAGGELQVTGALPLASRDDFREFDRQVRALRRSRAVAPMLAALVLVASGAAVWRWADLYALAAARAPALAALVPGPLRPAARADGSEHEPNDVPPRANPLLLPPGADGRPGGGVAAARGHLGAKLSADSGDVDLFRVEVPPGEGTRVLVATWRGEREGEGIRGLDAALALHRARAGERAAPLVAAANRGGAGAPERLVAAVEQGTYYLAVREHHGPAADPVEKPSDPYLLEVRLSAPEPGVELEPNDAPERGEPGAEAWPRWRALAGRNPLGAGARVRGELAGGDADVYAVAGGAALVAAIPAPGLALSARRFTPAARDLAAGAGPVALEPAADGAPGAVLLARLPPPAGGAPTLLELRAAEGEGAYDVVALAEGSGDVVLGLVGALAGAGRLAPALELAAGFADAFPAAPARNEVLLAAGRLAEEGAAGLAPAAIAAHDGAARLLGEALFEAEGGRVRYRGAFEGAARGAGPAAEEAALRHVALASPCTAAEVLAGASAFLARSPAPAPALAAEARMLRARALEDLFWAGGGKDRARREAALEAWRALGAAGEAPAGEAVLRTAALAAKAPSREGARPVCP